VAGVVAAFAGASWAAWLVQGMAEVPWQYKFWGTIGLFASLLLPMEVMQTLAGGVASGLKKRIGGKG
jgi:hypothetical protein